MLADGRRARFPIARSARQGRLRCHVDHRRRPPALLALDAPPIPRRSSASARATAACDSPMPRSQPHSRFSMWREVAGAGACRLAETTIDGNQFGARDVPGLDELLDASRADPAGVRPRPRGRQTNLVRVRPADAVRAGHGRRSDDGGRRLANAGAARVVHTVAHGDVHADIGGMRRRPSQLPAGRARDEAPPADVAGTTAHSLLERCQAEATVKTTSRSAARQHAGVELDVPPATPHLRSARVVITP